MQFYKTQKNPYISVKVRYINNYFNYIDLAFFNANLKVFSKVEVPAPLK